MITKLFTPNGNVLSCWRWGTPLVWFSVVLACWAWFRPEVFPSPVEVLSAFPGLWMNGLAEDLITSLTTLAQATGLSILVALPLSYVSRVPFIFPVATGLTKLRFLSPVAFLTLLLHTLNSGHQVKIGMLFLGLTFWLLTSMLTTVQNIPDAAFDDTRTLKMGEWRGTWYVVVRGTVDSAFDAIRMNTAMGWGMLMMVESLLRSEGGIGVLVANQERHLNFPELWMLLGVSVGVGILLDAGISWLKQNSCPWVTR